MLKLPAYQHLSEEQDTINNLPLMGSHLIVGPPGTGKTVMAIYRSSMLKRQNQKSHFFVYNNTLNQYLEQAMIETDIEATSTTFHSWFYNWYPKNFHSRAPEKNLYEFDWMKIYPKVLQKGQELQKYDHLIVDEGQDFPKEFYFFIKQIARNITVFADENQKITEINSTLEEIQTYLGIDTMDFLKRNYRNTKPIAEFAQVFYAGLQSGIPDIPERKGPKPRVLSALNLRAQIEFIARYERNNANKDIAIFVASNNQQEKIKEMLEEYTLKNQVQMYISNKNKYKNKYKKLDFRLRGIKILTYWSAKGLEFDTVFIPNLDTRKPEPDSDLEKMRFYVMTSRAKDELFLSFSGGILPPLLQNIPTTLYTMEYIA